MNKVEWWHYLINTAGLFLGSIIGYFLKWKESELRQSTKLTTLWRENLEALKKHHDDEILRLEKKFENQELECHKKIEILKLELQKVKNQK